MNNLQNIELDILKTIRNVSTNFIDNLMEIITILGEQYVIILLLLVIYFVYNKQIGKKLAYCLFTSLCLNGSIKGIVQRARPFLIDSSLESFRKETATGYSFPSGHSQNASTIYIGFAYNNSYKKRLVWTIMITISILIGFSRLVLAVHFPTDVLVGLCLGSFCSIFLSILYNKVVKNLKNEIILYTISLLIFTPFCFIFFKKDYNDIYIYRDFYICYALFIGYIVGTYLETKYVNFNNNTTIKIKIFRLLIAGIFYLITNFGLKLCLPKENIFCDIFRYFMITFIVIGIYPIIFKTILFKKEK